MAEKFKKIAKIKRDKRDAYLENPMKSPLRKTLESLYGKLDSEEKQKCDLDKLIPKSILIEESWGFVGLQYPGSHTKKKIAIGDHVYYNDGRYNCLGTIVHRPVLFLYSVFRPLDNHGVYVKLHLSWFRKKKILLTEKTVFNLTHSSDFSYYAGIHEEMF